MSLELTRRDALAALAAAGIGVGAGATVLDGNGPNGRDGAGGEAAISAADGAAIGPHERRTFVAVANVVYPSAITRIEPFVDSYLAGRAERDPWATGAADAVAALDVRGTEWHGGRFVDLDEETGDQLLREVGADAAEPDPDGTTAERVRYFLVNEVLFALYTSPTGGKLVGIENPQGHPGGLGTYQRGPRK